MEKPSRRPPGEVRAPTYEQHIPVKLSRAVDALEDVARLLLGDTHGLGLTDFRILAHLSEKPSASIADISRDLEVDKAWISRRVQGLGTRRYIQKQRDPSDSRGVLVSLTDTGRAAHETAFARVSDYYGAIMDGIDDALAAELIARLEGNLRRIAAELRSQDPAPGALNEGGPKPPGLEAPAR